MSDLDEELLDMVGGDSEDEVDDLDRLDEIEDSGDAPSPVQEAQPSVEKVEEPQSSRRGVAQKVKARGRRKRKQESENEDGDVSPSPEPSPRSSGAIESDGDADAPGEDDDEVEFPFEGQFYSRAERDEIMNLPEIDREAIIAERAEKVERQRQDRMLKKALASSSANKSKRKASTAELEEVSRRTTRPKTDKRSALDNYKRAREEKDAARSRRETDRGRRDERSPSSASDRDADGESEVEWAEPSSESRRNDPPPELRDFERCRVGRSNFAKICFYPKFEETIHGCFARVSIGLNRDTGQNQYRMTQIKGFAEGRPYQMENAHGKTFTTDQYAIVVQGNAQKPWPFSACSDSKFSESEFSRFMDAMKKDSVRTPSRKNLEEKVKSINSLLNQTFTEETLQIKFAKQRAMEHKYDPIQIAKQKRKDIAKRRAEAEANEDEEAIANCDAELEALDSNGSKLNGAVKNKPSPVKPMNQERLALLNASNRSKNQQEVRQALIAERKRIMKEREAVAAKKMSEEKAKLEEHGKVLKRADALKRQDMSDLFGETPNGSRAGTPGVGTPTNGTDTPKRGRAGTPASQNGVKKGPVGALKQKNLDEDVIGGLDFDIDIEI